ncbi:MAG TPA: thiamine pyrophosphate-dependent enzyme [Terracidiphilus sp.]|nr:thiamine pyrophosphate-dependent enzyme [Terracidiphilus sp.]
MIPREKLLDLYTAMMKCRMLAEHAATHNPAAYGAAFAAVACDLKARDTVAAATGAPLVRAARGASLEKALAALTQTRPRKIDPLAAAIRSAVAHKAAKSTHLAVAFCGNAPAAAWKKSLSLASRRSLPLIFVSLRASGAAPAFAATPADAPQALAFGVPLITVDAADLVAVYRVASEAFARARLRRIPTLIDAVLAPGSDPVATMESWLAARGQFTPALRRKVRADIARQLRAASLPGIP